MERHLPSKTSYENPHSRTTLGSNVNCCRRCSFWGICPVEHILLIRWVLNLADSKFLTRNLFEFFLIKRNEGKSGKDREHLTVLCATSGDTGSAAM